MDYEVISTYGHDPRQPIETQWDKNQDLNKLQIPESVAHLVHIIFESNPPKCHHGVAYPYSSWISAYNVHKCEYCLSEAMERSANIQAIEMKKLWGELGANM